MKTSSIAICATLLFAAPAFAFSGISAKYDGQYRGVAKVVPTSTGNCQAYTLDEVDIKGGHLSSPDVKLSGFITEEGYVDASVAGDVAGNAKLDGRLTGAEISAGAVDKASGCSWIVNLKKAE